jgi:hypothetical protein
MKNTENRQRLHMTKDEIGYRNIGYNSSFISESVDRANLNTENYKGSRLDSLLELVNLFTKALGKISSRPKVNQLDHLR